MVLTNAGILKIIKLMLTRIGVIASVFGQPDPMDLPQEYIMNEQHNGFTTLAEARTSLFEFLANSHSFFRDASIWKESLIFDNDIDSLHTHERPDKGFRFSIFGAVSDVDRRGLQEVSYHSSQDQERFSFLTRQSAQVQHYAPENATASSHSSEGGNTTDSLVDLFERTSLNYQASAAGAGSVEHLNYSDLWQRQMELQKRLEQWLESFKCQFIPHRQNRDYLCNILDGLYYSFVRSDPY